MLIQILGMIMSAAASPILKSFVGIGSTRNDNSQDDNDDGDGDFDGN